MIGPFILENSVRVFSGIQSLLCGVVVLSAAAHGAQGPDTWDRWYGKGVHAFFSGQDRKAYRELTRSIEADSKDPRCSYFRALVNLRLGRSEAAKVDMVRGAWLEVEDVDGYYPVDLSLERIQGRDRLLLEKYRQQARIDAALQDKARQRKRYESLRRREEHVLRRPVEIPLNSLVAPVGPRTPVAGHREDSKQKGAELVSEKHVEESSLNEQSFSGEDDLFAPPTVGSRSTKPPKEAGQQRPMEDFGSAKKQTSNESPAQNKATNDKSRMLESSKDRRGDTGNPESPVETEVIDFYEIDEIPFEEQIDSP